MLEMLASRLGRNDEEPNIALAVKLCEQGDKSGIEEIVRGLQDKDTAVANDCIKVLYEVGNREPELIAGYAAIFLAHLLSKNNRLAWGCMTSLGTIAHLRADEIYPKLDVVIRAYEVGSVITVDHSISVFAKLCKANPQYEKTIFPLILNHLRHCRSKEVPQHAERVLVCITSANSREFTEVLEGRKASLTATQMKRVDKVIKQAGNIIADAPGEG